MLLLLAIGFVAGIVTALSPCVLPVLPIVLAGGATGRRPLAIVAGIVVSFTVFTLFAAWLLDLLGLPDDLLRNLAIALLFLVSISLLVPQVAEWLARPLQRLTRRSGGDLGGGFLLGASLGPRLRALRRPGARRRQRDRRPPRLRPRERPAHARLRARRRRADARDRVRRRARRRRPPRPRRHRPPRLGRARRRGRARDRLRRRPEPADRRARLHGGAPGTLRALGSGATGAARADRRPRPRRHRRRHGDARGLRPGARLQRDRALAQLGAADATRAPRPGRPDRLLDVLVHQLPPDAALHPRMGRALPRRRADDRRRPLARVRLRAGRVERARERPQARPALPGRARQRVRHLAVLAQPVLAREVPDRQAAAASATSTSARASTPRRKRRSGRCSAPTRPARPVSPTRARRGW